MKLSAIFLSGMLIGLPIAAEALEPYDSSRSTEWLGVEKIQPELAGIGEQVPDVIFRKLSGEESSLYQAAGLKGTVVVVRDPECPVSIRYGPRISRMARNYTSKGFSFVFIYLNNMATAEDLVKDADQLYMKSIKAGKGSFAVAKAVGVRSTGDVFVLDKTHRLIYRGAIDDQYGFGYTHESPTHFYLRNAMEAVLKQWPVGISATLAPGCAIDADPANDPLVPLPPGGALS